MSVNLSYLLNLVFYELCISIIANQTSDLHFFLQPVVLNGLFPQIRLKKFFAIIVIELVICICHCLSFWLQHDVNWKQRRMLVMGSSCVVSASSSLHLQISFAWWIINETKGRSGDVSSTIHIVFPASVFLYVFANLDAECSRCSCLACVFAERSVKSICSLRRRIIRETMGTFRRRRPRRDVIVTATAAKKVIGELRTINRAGRGDVMKPTGSCWHLVVINSDVIIGGVTWKRFLLKFMSESVT